MADEHKDQHGDDDHGGKSHSGGHGGGHGGHGGGGHGEEHEGAPEWLISFADNVALLMGFFVILLAMNMDKKTAGGIGGVDKMGGAPNDRMIEFVIAMRAAFNRPIDINSNDPKEAYIREYMLKHKSEGETTTPGPEGVRKNHQAIEPSNHVNITGVVPFTENSADLSADGSNTLAEFSRDQRGNRWIIEVRGHVSATEASHSEDRGMDLAYSRSMVCVRELIHNGLKWNQLRIVACADSERRVGVARTSSEHQSNQRVELVITQEPVASSPFIERPE